MRKIKRLGALIMVAAMSISLCACGGTKKKENSTFKVACTTWVGNGMFFLAKEKGYFDGVDVDVKIIDDESTYASLLGSEQVDAVARAADQDIINYANGIKEKCVMTYDQSAGGDGIVVAEDIKSVSDLAGKTIAVAKATTSYFFLLTVLDANGMSEADVSITDMDADAAGTAFSNGEVEAAVTWEPWLSNADEREGGHLLCSSADYPNTIVDGMFVTDSYMNNNEESLKKVVSGVQKAVSWYYDGNQAEGNKIMADALGIAIEDFESQVEGVKWYDAAAMGAFFDESAEDSIYSLEKRAMSFWIEGGLISEEVDVNSFIDSSFIK